MSVFPHQFLRLLVFGLLLLAFSPIGLQAQRPAPLPALTGTSVTLTTSANRIIPHPLRADSPPPILGAMVTLRNHSRQAASFTFPDLDLARSNFTFSLFNAENSLIWTGAGTSPTRSAHPTSSLLTLAARSSWQAAVRIPLTTHETWLPAGHYRLEATLNGTPVTFAAGSFEIAALPSPPEPGASGIMGLVLAPAGDGHSSQTPAAGASITVEPAIPVSSPARGSFVYQGVTAADGRFDAKLPPGNYLVRVSWSAPQSDALQSSNQMAMNPMPPIIATKMVVVAKGRLAPLTLRLSAPRPPIRPLQPEKAVALSADEATAMVILTEDGTKKLRIQATGTVPHPGYTNARLIAPLVVPAIAPVEGNILFLQLVTDSPSPDLIYPQVITTVSAEVTLPFNEETVVWIFSQTNTLTAPVGPGTSSANSQ